MKAIFKISMFLAVIGSGCQSRMGPCVHIYEEPLITIVSATNEVTGEEISVMEMSDIRIDGTLFSPTYFDDGISENVEIADSALVCNLPCGFGTEGELFQFTVSAKSYEDLNITLQPEYSDNEGGCPSSSSDGADVHLALKPAGG